MTSPDLTPEDKERAGKLYKLFALSVMRSKPTAVSRPVEILSTSLQHGHVISCPSPALAIPQSHMISK
ncbi:hypothetical protein FRUB_01685 [Fimbriiglobus ruber]|uniref:Uncharacterized protein n=1 Tax=Fimbriiglobus ruber TaxID=1908690 RepID=A0A225E0M5_9BACT|nr:hypothetical protein FRUB_01685 [Fimbriiglobus ruber]